MFSCEIDSMPKYHLTTPASLDNFKNSSSRDRTFIFPKQSNFLLTSFIPLKSCFEYFGFIVKDASAKNILFALIIFISSIMFSTGLPRNILPSTMFIAQNSHPVGHPREAWMASEKGVYTPMSCLAGGISSAFTTLSPL